MNGLGHRARTIWVSLISAGLKALSPAGNRLKPMLAIATQGFLFSSSIVILGWNIFGVLVGGACIGGWAALQGIALQYLFVGGELIQAYDKIFRWIAEKLHVNIPGFVVLFIIWMSLHAVVVSLFTYFAWKRRHKIPKRIQKLFDEGASALQFYERRRSIHEVMIHALRDMTKPFFWLPVLIVIVIILLNGSSWNSVLWIVIRASTIGFIVFSLARAFDPKGFVKWLQRRGYWGPALAFKRAFSSGKKTTG